jgi:Zn-dependent M28 family amino/carboxypeptidase
LTPKRTVLFAEWNAEEMGLLGSKHYVAHPTLPLDDTIAAYNFDMVGSGDGSGVLLFGGDDPANRWLTDLMMNAKEAAALTHVIQLVPQKLASDHAPFVGRGIPVCWGFSRPDPHPGYHSPEDDMSRIKLQSLRAVSELFWGSLKPLAMGEEKALLQVSRPLPSVFSQEPPYHDSAGHEGCGH